MTKEMLKKVKEFVKPRPCRGYSGLFTDEKSSAVSLLCCNIAIIMYTDVSAEDEEQIKAAAKEISVKEPVRYNASQWLKYIDMDEPDRRFEVSLNELKQEVSTAKVKYGISARRKLYSGDVNLLSDPSGIYQTCGVVYNIELLYDTAKCLDKKKATVKFPARPYKPIILRGTYGWGMILPMRVEAPITELHEYLSEGDEVCHAEISEELS